MRTRKTTKLVSSGLGLIVLACLWFAFAPTALGGSTTYVVTDGVSMEPRFHAGDLVLVRSQSNYRVGQIVAYHSNVFHTIVLHRIIARDGNRYVFKGDNNNFVDFEHPAQSQLIGALWIHVAGAGAKLQALRSPALVGGLVAIGTLLLAGAAVTQSRRRRRRQRRAGEGSAATSMPISQYAAGPMLGVLAFGLLAMLPFLALALLAFTRPTSALLPADVPYRQSGALSYSADATPGPAYSGNRAATGDPLFTHVLSSVDLRYLYHFHTSARHALAGSAALYATVSSTSGWKTTLPLGAANGFRGNSALANGELDLPAVLALMRRVEATTAVGGSYTLTIEPRVNVGGTVGGAPLHTTFSPEIKFSLNQREVQPIASEGGALSGGPLSGASSSTNPFVQSTAGSATGKVNQPLYLSFKLTRLSVATARWIALTGILLISGIMLLLAAFTRPRRGREETAAIQARYGRMIVPVERVWQEPGVAVIDVADMDSLVQIAERYDRSILHETIEEGDAFWVTDESGQFRYALSAPAYSPLAPVYAQEPDYRAVESDYEPVTATYATVEPVYAPVEPDYAPVEPAYATAEPACTPVEPTYATAVPTYAPAEPTYAPVEPTYATAVPTYAPAEPTYAPVEPTYADAGHDYAIAGASYEPSSPGGPVAEGDVTQTPQLDPLAAEVYADELALGGAISATETRSPSSASDNGRAAADTSPSEDEMDAITRETNEWRAAWDSTDASRARAGGAFAGLERS
jgi:signal peptidase I